MKPSLIYSIMIHSGCSALQLKLHGMVIHQHVNLLVCLRSSVFESSQRTGSWG